MLTFTFLILFTLTSQSITSINSPCHASHQKFQNDIAIKTAFHREKRGATFVKDLLWPNGVIPYSISNSFADKIYGNIKTAIKIWETHTCLDFIPLTNETYGLKFEPQDCGCCSFVGRQQFGNNKPQEISISGQDCENVGHMLHEIGHAIGFWHEHVRPDRDKFVKLKESNIDPHSLHNFEKKNLTEINSLGERYDYNSIMHYSPRSFSRDNEKRTIIPVAKFQSIGQREQLSISDIRQANKLYSCQPDEKQCLKNNGGCQHYCVELHKGFKCRCRRGYLLGSDGKRCHLSCNGLKLEQPEGLIFSPNYPYNYPPDARCFWEIQAPSPYYDVKLQIFKLDIESSHTCIFDVLSIRRWYQNSWESVAELCGNNFVRKIIVRSPDVRLLFRSDSSVQLKGFKIFYQFVPTICIRKPKICDLHLPIEQQIYSPIPQDGSCDQEYMASASEIQFPVKKPFACITKISLRRQRKVVLVIRVLETFQTTDCNMEFLTIKAGNGQKMLRKLCGSMKSQIIYVDSNTVTLETVLKSSMSMVKISYFSY